MPHSCHQVAALIVPCSARKHVKPQPPLLQEAFPQTRVDSLSKAWLGAMLSATQTCSAASLYRGPAYSKIHTFSSDSQAPLFIISAGLGLLPSAVVVPTYEFSVGGLPPSIEPSHWWSAVRDSPFSARWSDVFAVREGLVLVALTQPYTKLVADDLAALPAEWRERIRLFGEGVERLLPLNLAKCVMPYDMRLDCLVPGTRHDFPHRALRHFARALLSGRFSAEDRPAQDHWIAAQLRIVKPETVPKRTRVADQEIMKRLRSSSDLPGSASATLRVLRDQWGLACEETRFRRIFAEAFR
jgi:hypothetical protein